MQMTEFLKKWVKDLNKQFIEEDIKIVNKLRKECLRSDWRNTMKPQRSTGTSRPQRVKWETDGTEAGVRNVEQREIPTLLAGV